MAKAMAEAKMKIDNKPVMSSHSLVGDTLLVTVPLDGAPADVVRDAIAYAVKMVRSARAKAVEPEPKAAGGRYAPRKHPFDGPELFDDGRVLPVDLDAPPVPLSDIYPRVMELLEAKRAGGAK